MRRTVLSMLLALLLLLSACSRQAPEGGGPSPSGPAPAAGV
ncbi:hypothetical protein [Lawsonibacter faecis]|nr:MULTISPECIES: hypothetical protein [Oscillospiraceae]